MTVQGVELSSLAHFSSSAEDSCVESSKRPAMSGRALLKRHFLRRIKHYLPQIEQAAAALTDVPSDVALNPYWDGTTNPNVLSPFHVCAATMKEEVLSVFLKIHKLTIVPRVKHGADC